MVTIVKRSIRFSQQNDLAKVSKKILFCVKITTQRNKVTAQRNVNSFLLSHLLCTFLQTMDMLNSNVVMYSLASATESHLKDLGSFPLLCEHGQRERHSLHERHLKGPLYKLWLSLTSFGDQWVATPSAGLRHSFQWPVMDTLNKRNNGGAYYSGDGQMAYGLKHKLWKADILAADSVIGELPQMCCAFILLLRKGVMIL